LIFFFIGFPFILITPDWLGLFITYASATFYAWILTPPFIIGNYYAFKYSSESEAKPPPPTGFF
jgi:hypothetical protein